LQSRRKRISLFKRRGDPFWGLGGRLGSLSKAQKSPREPHESHQESGMKKEGSRIVPIRCYPIIEFIHGLSHLAKRP